MLVVGSLGLLFGCAEKDLEPTAAGDRTPAGFPTAPPEEPSADTLARIAELEAAHESAKMAFTEGGDREAYLEAAMAHADYYMFVADLPPREKYPPALRIYREVLEVDPTHEKARESMEIIVDIYNSMGRPVPET